MAAKNDVYEFLVDGQSGLIPGDVSGAALFVGVCSKGTVGKSYRLGSQSDVRAALGCGPLADCVEDALGMAGQNAVLVAVPAVGSNGGYISPVTRTGTGPEATASGVPGGNADAVLEIVAAGLPGVATARLSLNGGGAWAAPAVVPLSGQVTLTGSGVTLVLPDDAELQAGTRYAVTVRKAVGPVAQVGTGPAITVAAPGGVKAGAQVVLRITRAGKINEGQYELSLDGGDLYATARTLPLSASIAVGDTGAVIALEAATAYELGTTFAFDLLPPVPTIGAVMEALEIPLARLDPEFVHVCGPTDAVDWAALSMLAQELFNAHRPTFITCEARLPYDGEDIDAWADWLLDERAKGAAPFVSVCAAYGEVLGRSADRRERNAGGLLAGRIMAIPVMRHVGRVLNGPVTPLTLPSTWSDAVQVPLKAAGFITATTYAGLDGVYFGDDKVLAEDTSDYQFLTVVRVVFKALRLLRIQALKSLFDEAGDPVQEGEAPGLGFLARNLEAALETMTKAIPRELAAAVVDIPSGQDIVNNGVAVETTLIGIPIIKKISLYTRYVYAGGSFDPRVEE
jgi:hypothetical protein